MQEHTIKNYLHHQPVQIYQDVGTGRNCKRTQLQQLLKDLVERDKVIIYQLSRLSRSLTDLWKMATSFKKMGVDFVSCSDSIDTSSANGRMVFKILGAVVEWEREIIAERTLESVAVRRSQGYYLGGVPYGWRPEDKQLVPDLEQQDIIEQIKTLREEGLRFAP